MSDESANKIKDIKTLHTEACAKGLDFYTDPSTGYQVFTELYHKRRGSCCGSGCRHCPWRSQEKKRR